MKEILDFIERNGPSTSKEIIDGLKETGIEGNLIRKNLSLMKGQDIQTLPIAEKGRYVSLFYRPQQFEKAIEKSKFVPLGEYGKVPRELISKPEKERLKELILGIDAEFKRYFVRLENPRTRGPAIRVLEKLVTTGTSRSLEPINRTLKALESSEFDEIKFDLYRVLFHLCIDAVEKKVLGEEKVKEIASIMYEKVSSDSVPIKEKRKAFDVWRVLKTEEYARSLLGYCWTTIETIETEEEYEKELRTFIQEIISWIIRINKEYKQEIENEIWKSLEKVGEENIRKRYEALLSYPLEIL